MTAQEVVRHFIEVSGDKKLLGEFKSTEAKAEGMINGVKVFVTVIKVFPEKLYQKFEIEKVGTTEMIYNNGKLKIKRNGKDLPGTDSSAFDIFEANTFVIADMAYEKLGYSMRLLSSDEKNNYKVELISPNGVTIMKYYDRSNGHLTKTIYPDNSVSYFSNYTTASGLTFSTKESIFSHGVLRGEVIITRFVVNPKVDSSLFEF